MRRYLSDLFFNAFGEDHQSHIDTAVWVLVFVQVAILAHAFLPRSGSDERPRAFDYVAEWTLTGVQVALLLVALLICAGDDDGRGGRKRPNPDLPDCGTDPLRVPKEWFATCEK